MKLHYYYIHSNNYPVSERVLYRWAKATGAEAERYNQYLCETLNAVAQWTGSCDRLLKLIEAVEQEGIEQIGGGNDVTLTFKESGVQVDIEVNDEWVNQPEGRFTLAEYKVALKAWREFLEIPESMESVLEVELPE